MTTPSIGGQPLQIVHPNGETILYLNPYTGTYTASKSYGLRMQRGYRRGLPQYEARGKPAGEAAIRRQQIQEQYGQTPWQRFTQSFERRYGFSYSYWRYLRRNWVDEINSLTSKDGFGHITPTTVSQIIQMWNAGIHDPYHPEFESWQAWVENRLETRLDDTVAYQEFRDKEPGRISWGQRNWLTMTGTGPPIEFYYYH